MTRSQLDKFKKILKEKLVELRPSLGKRDGIAIERSADVLDEIQLAGQRDIATRTLEREAQVLRDVRAALARIDDRTFGTCVDCEEEIGPRRLVAVPWAPLCIGCQERSDNAARAGIEVDYRHLADAA